MVPAVDTKLDTWGLDGHLMDTEKSRAGARGLADRRGPTLCILGWGVVILGTLLHPYRWIAWTIQVLPLFVLKVISS